MDLTDARNKTKTVIRSLLVSSPKPMTIHDLHNDHLRSEGHPIPFFNLGYSNLIQFLLSIPDILSISHSGHVIPETSNSQSQHIHEFVRSNASTNANRNRSYDDYCYQRPHPRIKIGYSSRNFNHDYELNRKMSQLDLKPLQGNATDKENEEQVKVIAPPTIADDVVQKQVDNDHATTNEGGRDQSALPILDEDDPIHLLGLELDGILKIPSPALTQFQPRNTYNVFVTETNLGPWSFWFSLCDNEVTLMEKQLLGHYQCDEIPMMPFEMVPENCCLVQVGKKVLRAEFIEKPINEKVKVCYVDYGTVAVVDISLCRRMAKYFASIPKQCFPGALELVKPIENDDKNKTKLVHRFNEMVQSKALCGHVMRVDHAKKLVRMVLIDTSNEKYDVIVNRHLLAFQTE